MLYGRCYSRLRYSEQLLSFSLFCTGWWQQRWLPASDSLNDHTGSTAVFAFLTIYNALSLAYGTGIFTFPAFQPRPGLQVGIFSSDSVPFPPSSISSPLTFWDIGSQ
jgi:hypothetical protein